MVAAEAVGAYSAASFCREIGIPNIILEGDSLQVVQSVTPMEESWTRFGHLVEDMQRDLQSLQSWQCCFVSR